MPDPVSMEPPENAEIGVLYVHGIGKHAEGDTLLSFGEPMIDWLRDWLNQSTSESRKGSVSVVGGRLRASRIEAESPAYALVDIETHAGAEILQERWLLTEAWWGSSVQVPRTAKLIAWMLTRVPMLVHWHFYDVAHQRRFFQQLANKQNMSALRFGSIAYVPIVPVLLSLLMQLSLGLALILWIIPIGPWRQGLLAAVRAMTLTLGDSFVLLEQDVQRAALVDRVKASLCWLASRSKRIVVIAHSQGGAIAHEALQSLSLDQVKGFISVGSGLEKLELLRLIRERRSGIIAASVVSPLVGLALATLAAAFFGWVDAGTGDAYWWVGPTLFFSLGAVFAVSALQSHLMQYHREIEKRLKSASLDRNGEQVRWWDVHATMDLVPMGRDSQLSGQPFVEQVEVTNECSLIFDHVRYFESRTGFLAWCWPTIAGLLSRLPLFDLADVSRLKHLQRQHRWRAYALGIGVTLSPLSIVVAMFALPEGMADVGRALLNFLDNAKLGWVEDSLDWITTNLARLASLIFHLSGGAAEIEVRSRILIGSLLASAMICAWWLLCLSAWRAANHEWWRKVCTQKRSSEGAPGFVRMLPGLAWWMTLAAMPLLALLVAKATGDSLTVLGIGRAIAMLVASLLFGVAVLVVCGWPWAEKARTQHDWSDLWGPLAFPALGLGILKASVDLWGTGHGPDVDTIAGISLLCCGTFSPLFAASFGRLPLPNRRWLAALWLLPAVAAGLFWSRSGDVTHVIGSAAVAVTIVVIAARLRLRYSSRGPGPRP